MLAWIYSGAGDLMIHARTIAILLLWLPSLSGQGTPAFNQEPSAKTWVGRYQEVEEYLRSASGASTDSLVKGIVEAVRLFAAGAPQSDDITALALRLRR